MNWLRLGSTGGQCSTLAQDINFLCMCAQRQEEGEFVHWKLAEAVSEELGGEAIQASPFMACHTWRGVYKCRCTLEPTAGT